MSTPTFTKPIVTTTIARSLFCNMLCVLALSADATSDAEPGSALFKQYEVFLGDAEDQTVLAGFFRGGAIADLAVVHIDENDDRRLRMYGFDAAGATDSWVPVLDATLPDEVLFIDVAHVGGRDRLVTYEHGRVTWFDPDSATQRPLARLTTGYKQTRTGEIPHADITRALNRDGRDDLLVPDVDGFWVVIQLSDGSFADAVKFGPPEPFLDAVGLDESGIDHSRSYREVGITAFTLPLYQSRVHDMDYNQDGRTDLVFWNQDHFHVHLQNPQGLFDPAPEAVTADMPFDADGVYSRMFEFSDAGMFATLFGVRKNSTRTTLHSLRDMDGDGLPDLVTLSLTGRSPLRQRSVYRVYPGMPTREGVVFSRHVSTAIRPRGKAGAGQPWGYSSQWFEDFDGDGQIDLMLADVTFGLGGMIRALAAGSIGIDLEFYRMDGGVYPDKPGATRKIRTPVDPFGRSGLFFPAVLLGDVNGDGRADLLIGENTKELSVFVGKPGPGLFARQPETVTVTIPADGLNARLLNLNEDDRRDILMHHTTTHPRRLTMLIAQ